MKTNLNIPGKRGTEPGKLVYPGICKLKYIHHQDCVYGYYSEYLGFLYQCTLKSLIEKVNEQTNK